MYAGAPRVVASLWNVDDRATAELMKRFYARLLKEGEPAGSGAPGSAGVDVARASAGSRPTTGLPSSRRANGDKIEAKSFA